MKPSVLAVVSAAALLVAGAASAHHSFAMYDREKTLTLSGTVKEFAWTSPHVSIEVLADNAKGGVVAWAIEGGSPGVLSRGGWTSSVLRPGDKVSLGVHPRKDGGPGGLLADEQPLLVNGQTAKGVLSLQPQADETCER